SQSCPFCRVSLRRVNSTDLWIYTDNRDIVDCSTIEPEVPRRRRCLIEERNPAANDGRARCVSCRRCCWREERDPGGVLWRRRGGEGRGEGSGERWRRGRTKRGLSFSFFS
uniref:RING-type domain-containing protein n=1 Tax=Aegilops tauschii subsp. strangulata TaxID=200361 RepID=A0A452YY44_AEGTS